MYNEIEAAPVQIVGGNKSALGQNSARILKMTIIQEGKGCAVLRLCTMWDMFSLQAHIPFTPCGTWNGCMSCYDVSDVHIISYCPVS